MLSWMGLGRAWLSFLTELIGSETLCCCVSSFTETSDPVLSLLGSSRQLLMLEVCCLICLVCYLIFILFPPFPGFRLTRLLLKQFLNIVSLAHSKWLKITCVCIKAGMASLKLSSASWIKLEVHLSAAEHSRRRLQLKWLKKV